MFSGCTTVRPPIQEYRLNPKVEQSALQKSSYSEKSLKVAQAFSSSALMTNEMSYAYGDYSSDIFRQSQWAESPNKAITAQILNILQKSNLFKNVQISKSRSKSGLVLETNIEEFMQYFSEDENSSLAKVALNVTIIDATKNTVLHSKTFSQSVKVYSLNAKGGVIALNQGLSNVLIQIRDWLSEICK